MRISGNGNLAALVAAFVIGLTGLGLVHQSAANPPSTGQPTYAPPPTLVPPARAKPAPVTPPYKPNTNSAGSPAGQAAPPILPPARAPLANCRAACATSCNNSTPCTELSVTQCTSARQRCRLQCSSSC